MMAAIIDQTKGVGPNCPLVNSLHTRTFEPCRLNRQPSFRYHEWCRFLASKVACFAKQRDDLQTEIQISIQKEKLCLTIVAQQRLLPVLRRVSGRHLRRR